MKHKLSLFHKLFLLFGTVLVLALIFSFFLIQTAIQDLHYKKNSEFLQKHIEYLKSVPQIPSQDFLNHYARLFDIRITLIHLDGTVFYDSENNPTKMENHLNRPEIKGALSGKKSMARRYSQTLKKEMLYMAKATKSDIIRVSIPMDNIEKRIHHILLRLLGLYIFLFTMMMGVIYYLTRNIVKPLRNLIDSSESFLKEYHIKTHPINSQDDIDILTQSFNDLRQQISKNIEKLKKMEQMRKEFIANISHELKTPLTSILGFIETLEAGALDDPKHNRHFLEIMKKNAQRLHLLVEDILSLAHIENQKTDLEKLNLVDVLKKLINEMDLSDDKRIHLKISHQKISLHANRREIHSAMLNYIHNALKYCPKGFIKIMLKKESTHAYFAVKDSGPGIEKEHQLRLFERFYRPDKTRSRVTGGTGLGLAIVKNVVEKYKGEVGLKSEPGQGSLFYFKIPLKPSSLNKSN